jgi:hypothetical protein
MRSIFNPGREKISRNASCPALAAETSPIIDTFSLSSQSALDMQKP